MSITQTSKIRVRTGDYADLPQLSPGEFGFATDEKRLFVGNQPLNPFVSPGNTEILTEYSAGVSSDYNFGIIGQTVTNPVSLLLQMSSIDFDTITYPSSVELDLGTF
jgi:hypothetical protein